MWDLRDEILALSESRNFMMALTEWEVTDMTEEEDCSGQCVCTKEGCRYLYEITNKLNNNVIQWLGSQCIKKVGGSLEKDMKALNTKECKIRKGVLKGKTFQQVYDNHLQGEVSKKYLLYEEVRNRIDNIDTICSHCQAQRKLKDGVCRDCIGVVQCSHCHQWGCHRCGFYLDTLKKFDNCIVDFGKYKGVPFRSFLRPDYRMESYINWTLTTLPPHIPFHQYLRAIVYLKK